RGPRRPSMAQERSLPPTFPHRHRHRARKPATNPQRGRDETTPADPLGPAGVTRKGGWGRHLLLMCSPRWTRGSLSPLSRKNQSRAWSDTAAVTESLVRSSLTVVPKFRLAVPLRPPPVPVLMSWDRVA